MAIASIRCPILGARVTRVTDLEGAVARIICVAYDHPTGTCRLKTKALTGGPLTQLLERAAENTLHTRDPRCALDRGADVLGM
jgi:hypothetical protein